MTTMLALLSQHLTPTSTVLALLTLIILYNVANRNITNRRIARLGARAPIRTTYFPYGLDMLYEVLTYMLADKNLELWFHMFQKYGKGGWTIEGGIGERVVLTAEPENIKAILATQFKDYGKGEQFQKDWNDFLGHGIFATDGQYWHDSRQLIRPQFIKDRLSDLDLFEEHVQVLLGKLGGEREVDGLDMFFRFTLDAATHFLFGKSIESLHYPQTDFADAFYNVQRIQSIIARIGNVNWIVPRRRMGFYDSLKVINDFVNIFIEKALSLTPQELKERSSHDQGYTFLHAIAAYTQDHETLRDQLVSILLAGRDTTAATLTWLIYELSMNHDITTKLRYEIIECVGLERRPTYEDLKNMKYLQHVLNETLRLYPVVPFNVRLALVDTTLPVGGGPDGTQPIGILKGTPIGYSTLAMQRRTDLYPPPESGFPAIERFVPERWDVWTPKSWTYIPFNGGPRICIGQQFALTEMAYTIVRLLQRFEVVENRMADAEPGLHCDIILQPAKEVRVIFRQRQAHPLG